MKQYVGFDWSDPELVNGEDGRLARVAYHESIAQMYLLLNDMKEAGASTEEIARAVSSLRNQLRMEASEGLETLKARNLEKYGHEEGPLPDESFEKYGSWEIVIEKAFIFSCAPDGRLEKRCDFTDGLLFFDLYTPFS